MIVSAFINIRNPSDMFSYLYYDLYDGFWCISGDKESSISCVLVGLSFQNLFYLFQIIVFQRRPESDYNVNVPHTCELCLCNFSMAMMWQTHLCHSPL